MPRKSTARRRGILLDIGSGLVKRGPNWTHMDVRPLPGIDVVHDMEKFPWPFKSESVLTVTASHVLEHVKPWHQISLFNEVWRILKTRGQFAVCVPYGVNAGYLQDPTHCTPFVEGTFLYYDPYPPVLGWDHTKPKQEGKHNVWYDVYKPKPWRIQLWYWESTGDMEVVLEKRPLSDLRGKDREGVM